MSDYFELKLKINPQSEEIISDIIFENFDCEGVVLAEEEYDDDLSSNLKLVSTTQGTLKAYLKSTENIAGRLTEQRNLLLSRGYDEDAIGSWDYEISKVENQDWSKKWKENWGITKVSDKISVIPSWIEYEQKEGEIALILDPGSAFGTGTHPTTQLCMQAIEEFVQPKSIVADIGTGSGILAICAAKFGAEFVYACDNDELVIETAQENALLNKVSDNCIFECNTTDKIIGKYSKKFDLILANILHNVLAEIMPELKKLMKKGGLLSLSGILDEKKQVVLDSIAKNGLIVIKQINLGEWTSFVVSAD